MSRVLKWVNGRNSSSFSKGSGSSPQPSAKQAAQRGQRQTKTIQANKKEEKQTDRYNSYWARNNERMWLRWRWWSCHGKYQQTHCTNADHQNTASAYPQASNTLFRSEERRVGKECR